MARYKYSSFLPGIGSALPALSGPIGDVVNQIIGPLKNLFTSIFGGGYATSTGVRWLAAWYKHYVLGQQCASPTSCVGDADTAPAQAFFTAVTGVPIYDRYRMAALQGWDVDNNRPFNNTDADRVNMYRSLGPLESSVDPDIVNNAVQIAKKFVHGMPVGGWAQFAQLANILAPQVKEYLPDASGTGGTDTVTGAPTVSAPIKKPFPWVWLGIGALVVTLAIILIAKTSKK